MLAGIKVEESEFIVRLRKRFGTKLDAVPAADPTLMTFTQANTYLVSNKLLMNKIEMENLFDHYGVAAGKGEVIADMERFVSDLKTDKTGSAEDLHQDRELAGPRRVP